MTRYFSLACVVFCLSNVVVTAQDDEFKYGLIGQYHSGTDVVERIDPDLAFNWGKAAPHVLTSGGKWNANWSGQILIRSLTPYRFHLQATGEVVVEIDGKIVLQVHSEKSQWTSGESVSLSPGFRDISVTYAPATTGGELKLFWSSEEFAVEPVPSHLLFHQQDDSQIQLVEQGRQLFDAHRCANCHHSPGKLDQLDPAPALWGVTTGTNNDWIIEKLMGKNPEAPTDKMPHFGFTREQATDILAYLHRLEAPFDLTTVPEPKPKKGDLDGKELFNSLGCLACHQVGDLGSSGPFSGSPLTHIGNKRSADWIATWLAVPDRLNPQHRMPIFKLSRTERGLLAHYLAAQGKRSETRFGRTGRSYSSESSDRGQALVKEFQCANCHKIPAIEAAAAPAKSLVSTPDNWEQSCLGSSPAQPTKQPRYPNVDRQAIGAYLQSLEGKTLSPASDFELGHRVLERKQCLACHSRGGTKGLKAIASEIASATPALQGQSQVVIPPSLNAVGDKLQDSVLDAALSGKQDRVRANWLMVRMPEFHHSKQELDLLKHYLVEHDRIPASGATQHPPLKLSQNELLLTGRKLVGAGGWSCIACHQIGDYVPENTAIGTRGSDLMSIGKRLRPEFYYRWTRAPIRVVPGMEMPSFIKPVAGVLEENVHDQLGAIWAAVNDDRFEAPTNPSQVEQLWQVTAGEDPRIVRDVFTVDKTNGGGTVARAFAVGFSNQHGILIDLDRMSLRDWRFGDFARQRTVGKSWYWDLAGASVVKGFENASDFVFVNENDNSVTELAGIDADRIAHLKHYSTNNHGVDLHYELKLNLNGQITLPVVERLEEVTVGSRSGWRRKISVSEIPKGLTLAVRPPKKTVLFFSASMEKHADSPSQKNAFENGELIAFESNSNGTATLVLDYMASCSSPQVALPERKVVLPAMEKVTTWPGYEGRRLPISASLMPTALARDDQGQLLITSLKGDVVRVTDTDGDELEDRLELLAEGLSAPFGVIADGNDILVTHKPELLRLSDTNGDGRYTRREIVADGWGHSDNYHDWVTGPVFDRNGNLFVATGSDYAQPKRDRSLIRWRGKVVRATTDGRVEAFAHELRYPIGIATDAQGRIFVSDQQGVQNTFNEINHIVEGGAYGVPGQMDGAGSQEPRLPTIQIPHPWTRSVNGIFFLPDNSPGPFAGHGIGCEYNQKFLIRFSMHEVDGQLQGACYPLTQLTWEKDEHTFLGPICGLATPDGEIYIGSIYDSGWLGGPNVGEIVRLRPTGEYGNGIREIRAVPGGLVVEFIAAIDPAAGIKKENYAIAGYTRIWKGAYATEDSGRYAPEVEKITIAEDQRTVTLAMPHLKSGFVYELNVGAIGTSAAALFPSFGAYTMNRLPGE